MLSDTGILRDQMLLICIHKQTNDSRNVNATSVGIALFARENSFNRHITAKQLMENRYERLQEYTLFSFYRRKQTQRFYQSTHRC